jgi:hypothetical protein
MACDRYIPQMSLTLGRYTLTQDFYVVDIPDTNIILGVQWLSTLGPITTNYKTMEMSFNSEEGKRVTLEGNDREAPRVVTTNECMQFLGMGRWPMQQSVLLWTQNTHEGHKHQHYPPDIQKYFTSMRRFLDRFLQGNHQIGDLSTS